LSASSFGRLVFETQKKPRHFCFPVEAVGE
jgi:hypothetical protein